jgi:[ribosomal protein S5]-alanine N-acetyltransferase
MTVYCLGMRPSRLLLVGMTYELLDAATNDQRRLGSLINASISEGWEGFPEALPGLRAAYSTGGGERRWGTLCFVLAEPRTLIGMGGYKGAPSPEGIVEIGYAIAPAYRGQGLATEATHLMVDGAFADPRVQAVDAHTLAHENPSTRVLEKAGFRKIGERIDPDDGPIWHWRLGRNL